MYHLLLGISIIFLLGGLILRFMSRSCMTELGQSISWYNVKYWFAPWKAVDVFTDKGLRLHITSISLITISVVLYLFVQLRF